MGPSQPANSSYHQSAHHHGSRSRTTENQDQQKSKTIASNSKHTHSRTPRAKSSLDPAQNQRSKPPEAKHKTHSELSESRRSSHDSNHEPASTFQPSSQHSPKRAKHLAPVSSGPRSYSKSTSTAAPNSKTGVNSKSNTNQLLQAKTTAPPVHVNPVKTPQKKSQAKQQEHRGGHPNIPEGRKQEKKEDRRREKPAGKPGRREERRLAEEQLRRRPWIQSSAEEDEEGEEEEAVVRERPSNRIENSRRSDKHHRGERRSAQNKQTRSLQEQPQRQERADAGRRSEGARHPSLQLASSPTPQKPSSSSSASSNSDSESEYQAPVPKVPADSTSNKKVSKSRLQGPADRPKQAHPGGSSLVKTSEGKQKLYTLVPFGRGDKAPAFSQRGLRNLVVQIDLCLLKRVPESPAASPGKKTPPYSGASSTKSSQREMKHALVSEARTKDGRRKRKVRSGHTSALLIHHQPTLLRELPSMYARVFVCL